MEVDALRAALQRTHDRDYPGVPLYQRVVSSCRDDPVLLGILQRMPDHLLAGGLLLAAFHYLVLSHPDEDFAVAWRKESLTPGTILEFKALLRDFASQHESELNRLVAAHRGSQLNEVTRCGYLVLALGVVADQRRVPLAMLDVGTSAGLTLNFDLYRYCIGGRSFGPRSDVLIDIEIRGELPPALPFPEVRWRRGIDRAPIDATSEVATRWLRACVPPQDIQRTERLRGALHLARSHPPAVVVGDAVELGKVAELAPADQALVVVTTSVLMYLDADARAVVRDRITQLAATRTIDWLICEPAKCLTSLGLDIAQLVDEIPAGPEFNAPLLHLRSHGTKLHARRLALTGAHGRWIMWEPAT